MFGEGSHNFEFYDHDSIQSEIDSRWALWRFFIVNRHQSDLKMTENDAVTRKRKSPVSAKSGEQHVLDKGALTPLLDHGAQDTKTERYLLPTIHLFV